MIREIIKEIKEIELRNYAKKYNNKKTLKYIEMIDKIYDKILKMCKAYGQIKEIDDELHISIKGKRLIDIVIAKGEMNVKIFTTNLDFIREIDGYKLKDEKELLEIIKRACENRI